MKQWTDLFSFWKTLVLSQFADTGRNLDHEIQSLWLTHLCAKPCAAPRPGQQVLCDAVNERRSEWRNYGSNSKADGILMGVTAAMGEDVTSWMPGETRLMPGEMRLTLLGKGGSEVSGKWPRARTAASLVPGCHPLPLSRLSFFF